MKARAGRILCRVGGWRLQRGWVNARHPGCLRILSAHRVIDAGRATQFERDELRRGCLSLAGFREAMAHLRREYRIIALDEAVDNLIRGQRMPANALVLTFDDAYGDVCTNAAPLLTEWAVPFTVFLTAGWIDAKPDILSSDQVAELAGNPLVTWGAHGMTHRALTDMTADRRKGELVESRRRVEALTGRGVRSVCYPDGLHNADVVRDVQTAGYEAACATGRRLNVSPIDRFALQRIPFEAEPLWRFALRVAGRV